MQALAERSSLLPMENGYYQTVQGLSVENVTGDLGKIGMEPVMGEQQTSWQVKSPAANFGQNRYVDWNPLSKSLTHSNIFYA